MGLFLYHSGVGARAGMLYIVVSSLLLLIIVGMAVSVPCERGRTSSK